MTKQNRIAVGAIQIATVDSEISRCFPLMAQLRPHLLEHEFVGRVRRQIAESGYTLVYLEDQEKILSLAGFRISECLFYGRYLYVDDLVTDQAYQGQGHGSHLFKWLIAHAKEKGCQSFVLDSGVQRFDAHRFYLQHRMRIDCHHFSLRLE